MEPLTISERIARGIMSMSREEIAAARNRKSSKHDDPIPKVKAKPETDKKKSSVQAISLAAVEGLPSLEVLVTNPKTNDVIAHLNIKLCSLILSPTNQVLYLEAVSTSANTAHAIMGAVADARGLQEWYLYTTGGRQALLPPAQGHCADLRLDAQAWRSQIHHLAIVDRSGSLLLSNDDELLWQKIRSKMTCPTLDHWKAALLPQIMDSSMLLRCEAFGIPTQYQPYVLADDAEKQFDRMVCQYVAIAGIKECA